MAAEPELISTSIRRAEASTSPSLGWLSCRMTSLAQWVSSCSHCSAAMAIPEKVSSFSGGRE
eukprot:4098412-Pyramimonas_sp.AAC.1